jgi:hypothetical protein
LILGGNDGVEAELENFPVFVIQCNTQLLLVSYFLEHICYLLLTGLRLIYVLLLTFVLEELQDESHNLLEHLLLLLGFHQLTEEMVVDCPLLLMFRA